MLGSGNTSEGARRKSGSTENKTLTGKMSIDTKRPPRVKSPLGECKSPQDNQMDSGFMSGSNLQSSSSLCSGELGSKDIEFSLNSRIHSDEGQSNTSKRYTSDNLDSGIDLSERISSLDISSAGPSLSPAQSPDPPASAGVISAPSSAEPRSRPGLGLSPAHITILKEIFKKDNDGDTQLHVAVIRGFVEVVGQITSLLPHQALLDIPNNSGRTALHLAVGSGDSCVARHLIVCGASPVAKNRKGETPLHIACRDGDPCMVSWLTSQVTVYEVVAARLSYPPNHTPGLLAADLNNYDGQTCIHIAAQHGHQQILQHLTWYGADINAKEGKCGRTALHLAVEARNKELVRFLVESCRAEISIRNYAGLTPYQLAVANEAPELVSLLDELGAQKDPLPPAYSADEDLECEEDSSSLETDEEYQWSVNDLRFGSGHHYANPIPVSSHSPFNADQYL